MGEKFEFDEFGLDKKMCLPAERADAFNAKNCIMYVLIPVTHIKD